MLGDDDFMRLAIEQAERARGDTGDNPWVGCVIVGRGRGVLGQGYTRGPGEHHAEISAAEDAAMRGQSVLGATLYSTLEPCSFHGRTPACAHAIAKRGLRRVVVGMRDPHPRVDGLGLRVLRQAGVEVVEGVCEAQVRRQLAEWILTRHAHAVARYAAALPGAWGHEARLAALIEHYGLPAHDLEAFARCPNAAPPSELLRPSR
ncbi:MAG TPA: bifunctional diaminohydroxyphosphoribosylaminopyrimidine deaminase/5-amino-6-(5-phosphoribosylamino)uracil reductase RibD [Polyangiaceae bacterium]|jgi:diaminohydroxyphosphoribosylaminopyrimidine deaminase/5-amino-6-(5-phosphoribosylamino)uracil reductase|nr:bifunctional diaminohydroxyphosphoribosylaminopyrimidine deaminase/5-amino-6-(5-phosphoribosylamino)uracil reductase RibD [Polyangiaceae bacterium]